MGEKDRKQTHWNKWASCLSPSTLDLHVMPWGWNTKTTPDLHGNIFWQQMLLCQSSFLDEFQLTNVTEWEAPARKTSKHKAQERCNLKTWKKERGNNCSPLRLYSQLACISLPKTAPHPVDILLNPNSLTPPPQPPTKTSNQPAPWRPLILPVRFLFSVPETGACCHRNSLV